jgi:hypothetical protein
MSLEHRRASVLRSSVLLVLVTACSSVVPPEAVSDIATQIKILSSRTGGATSVKGDMTTYSVYVYNMPRGYQNLVTLTERTDHAAVSVWVYETLRNAQQLTLLVDEPLDGRLDYTASAAAPSIRDAYALINLRPRSSDRRDLRRAQAAYDMILRHLQSESLYVTTAVKPQ